MKEGCQVYYSSVNRIVKTDQEAESLSPKWESKYGRKPKTTKKNGSALPPISVRNPKLTSNNLQKNFECWKIGKIAVNM